MVTKTVNGFNLVGRLTVPDPNLPSTFVTYNADFSADASIEFDFTTLNQAQQIGVIKGMFIDNSSNPSEVTVSVSNTDQYFTIPNYAEGYFKIDAQINSRIQLNTEGGATDQVTVTFYNRDIAPNVWYRYGAINKDIALKFQGANPTGSNLSTDEFNNPIPIAGVDPDGNIFPVNTDANGNLIISGLDITIGAIYGADDVGTAPTHPGVLIAGVDPSGNVANANTNSSGDLKVEVTNPTTPTYPNVGTASSIAASTADTVILAANVDRRGATIFNDGTAILYILLSSAVSSNTNYTTQVQAGGYYEVPFGYTGDIKGIWSAANGAARVTEIS